MRKFCFFFPLITRPFLWINIVLFISFSKWWRCWRWWWWCRHSICRVAYSHNTCTSCYFGCFCSSPSYTPGSRSRRDSFRSVLFKRGGQLWLHNIFSVTHRITKETSLINVKLIKAYKYLVSNSIFFIKYSLALKIIWRLKNCCGSYLLERFIHSVALQSRANNSFQNVNNASGECI